MYVSDVCVYVQLVAGACGRRSGQILERKGGKTEAARREKKTATRWVQIGPRRSQDRPKTLPR